MRTDKLSEELNRIGSQNIIGKISLTNHKYFMWYREIYFIEYSRYSKSLSYSLVTNIRKFNVLSPKMFCFSTISKENANLTFLFLYWYLAYFQIKLERWFIKAELVRKAWSGVQRALVGTCFLIPNLLNESQIHP